MAMSNELMSNQRMPLFHQPSSPRLTRTSNLFGLGSLQDLIQASTAPNTEGMMQQPAAPPPMPTQAQAQAPHEPAPAPPDAAQAQPRGTSLMDMLALGAGTAGGGSAFQRGWQRAEHELQQRSEQTRHTREQEIAAAARARQQQWVVEDRAHTIEERKRSAKEKADALKREFRSTVAAELAKADTREEWESQLTAAEKQGDHFGLTKDDVRGMFTPPSEQRQARALLERIKGSMTAEQFQRAEAGVSGTATWPFNGEQLGIPQLRARSGVGASGPDGAPMALSGIENSEFERWFSDDFLPAELEQRRANGLPPPPRSEVADLKLKARTKWTAAGREQEKASGPTDADKRRQRTDAIASLRDKVTLALRQKKFTSQLAKQIRGLGLDVEVEVDRAARSIEREAVAGARARDLAGPDAEFPSADDLIAGAQGALVEPPPAPRPGPILTAPQAGRTRTANKAHVDAVAKARGVTYAVAKRELEARGVKVMD